MNIRRIEYKGFRGFSGKHNLTDKTFITGPNRSGKSTILLVPYFVLYGELPDSKPSELVQNASGGYMCASITINGHIIERDICLGDNVKTVLRLDGEKVSTRKAKEAIHDAIGQGPAIINMPAFWAASPKDQRAMVLRCTGSQDVADTVAALRVDRNAIRKGIKAQKVILAKRTADLAGINRPVGSIKAIEKRYAEVNATISDLQKQVAASDERKRLQKAYAELHSVKDYEKQLADNAATLAEIESEMALLDEEIKASKKPVHDDLSISEAVSKVLRDASDLCDCSKAQSCPIASTVRELISPEAMRIGLDFSKQTDEYHARLLKYQKLIHDRDATLENSERIKNNIERAKKMALVDVGVEMDPDTPRILSDLRTEANTLLASIKTLESWTYAEKQMESARADLAKQEAELEKIEVQLESAEKAHLESISDIETTLTDRAGKFLDGRIQIHDDGLHMAIGLVADNRNMWHSSMSGSDSALFDAALGHALAPEAVIAIEAAELDDQRLRQSCLRLADMPCQILTASWYCPGPDPFEGWEVIHL